MVTRPVVVAVICVGFFLILQALVPKAMALKKPSYVDRFMMEGHRTHKRKNYMVQRARDKEIIGSPDNGVAYDVEPFDPERNPEELSAFIVDYANMIRDDVILLDKSVETRTRKRGNIKVKKYNQAIPDPPCGCDYSQTIEDLGEDTFPRKVLTRKCKKGLTSCRPPYICKENSYYLSILIKRRPGFEQKTEDIEVHHNLTQNWYAAQYPIGVGCTCIAAYSSENNDQTG